RRAGAHVAVVDARVADLPQARLHEVVAAGRRVAQVRASVVVVAVLAVVAGLAAVDDAVAAGLRHAGRAAAVAWRHVAVVTALRRGLIAVAADVELTAGVTGLARAVVGPVVASLVRLDDRIPALGQ